MKKRITTIILVIMLAAGLSLLLYPTVSNWWNQRHQSHAIENYQNAVDDMSDKEIERKWKAAREYNKKLKQADIYGLSKKEEKEYNSLLNIGGDGVMGFIDIPSIKCHLPIYHGTSDAVLQTAIGHIPGTSLPVGGKSSHCVVSGHRGLPSARLFTDIDKLKEGDVFTLTVLDKTLMYQVDQIRTVLPEDLSNLQITEGEDYVTLVTCTPYGINTHRLLVRGRRIADNSRLNIPAEAEKVDERIVAPLMAIPILLILYIILRIRSRRNKIQEKED
ncbi:MAG: class C sortase [Lachnospiraceae bacterium]|nr:class C sortase [Lachnospiraceae bacterium]